MGKEIRHFAKQTALVRQYQKKYQRLTDLQLFALTQLFRERMANGQTADDLLPEAFAAICEADRRLLGKDPFDVQIMAGVAMHEGYLAEMGTGEGKTLAATLPLYLNALSGQGAMLVTTNSYLAIRDYEEMKPVFLSMGLTVEVGASMKDDQKLTTEEKQKIYAADVLYTTHGNLGFDYLLNNLVESAEDRFMRPFHFIVIDEADSVLLDAAQTPLVISGSPRVQSNLYGLADLFVTLLREGVDYEKEDEKVWLTAQGIQNATNFFQIDNFYDEKNFEINRHVILALRAHALFEKGKDYTVSNKNELILLDSGTGRSIPGVKLRGGQHQALEVKEGIRDSMETRSVASITFQNLFLLFPKMSGMSGTIYDAREELLDVYGTPVAVIPPNRPVRRVDYPDIYLHTENEKFEYALNMAIEKHKTGQPVLIIASTIAETERVSKVLVENRIAHSVLNANNAYWEASIIKEAGKRDTVTVATAMAGRGTDIRLGPGVAQLGGLAVIGIGRMANTRLERQVRGRSGRQGDPGFSQFFVALTDHIVQRNQQDQMERAQKSKRTYSTRAIARIINRGQRLEEEYAVLARKSSVAYDLVLKKQRQLIYSLRNQLLDGGTLSKEQILEIASEGIRVFLAANKKPNRQIMNRFILDNLSYRTKEFPKSLDFRNRNALHDFLIEQVEESFANQLERIGSREEMDHFVRVAVLSAIDEAWVDEVDYLQQLQSAIQGRSSAQRNLIYEFQNDAYVSFQKMERQIKTGIIRNILLSDVYLDETQQLQIIFP